MKHTHALILLCLISFSFLNAQITNFITGIQTEKIIIDGDDLYYISVFGGEIYKVDISDLAFPSTLPLYTHDPEFPNSMTSLVINGNDLYFGTTDPLFLQYIYKLNLTDLEAGANELSIFYACSDIAFQANQLYTVATGYINVYSTNTLLEPLTTTGFYETFSGLSAYSLYNDGFTLYIGTSTGEIYTKNLLTGGVRSLLYTSGSGNAISEILKFEGLLYFADVDGVHRFNPLDPSPITQTIADDSEFINFPIGLAAKAYPSGDNYLFVSDSGEKIIKIDLNDPTLSINETIANESMVFPNPTLHTITINASLIIEELSVYDLLGKRLIGLSLSNQVFEYNLDISSLNSGVYNLQIKTSKGTESKKIIKL